MDAAALLEALDLVIGAIAVTAAAISAVGRALEPSFVPARLRPRRVLAMCARPLVGRGRHLRERVTGAAVTRFDAALPVVVDLAMTRLQPTELVRRYVDLDELVAGVDLDAVAERLDVQAVVARVDLDEAARRLDVEAVLDRIDLTATVLRRVDLKVVVEAVLAQIDLPSLVEGVLDDIDLPEVIRESTGAMASDTVRAVRMQGVNADQAVSRLAERLRLLRSRPTPGGAT